GGAFGQDSSGGDPTGAAPHHLNQATHPVSRGHAADVGGNLHHGCPVVFDDRTVPRAVVGVGQVVIDSFGHAIYTHFVAARDGLFVDFMGGVLGIVAPDIKKVANVVCLEDLEQPVHVFGGSLGPFFEIQLVAAGA